MTEKHLAVPLSEEDVRSLEVGDIVYLDGIVYTGRDEVHIHALERAKEGKEIPVDFKDGVIFHCGPIMKRDGDKWVTVAAGPTTSSRMNSLEPEFIEKFGARTVKLYEELDTSGVPPTAHPISLSSVFRSDEPQPSYPQDDILANAPRREEDFFKVKAILE